MEIQFRRSVISGKISAPPSPAASQRALIAASLAQGQSLISNLSPSPDVQATISACVSCGADIVTEEGVADVFGGDFSLPANLDCNESNSTLKLFMGLSAFFGGPSGFSGSGRLTVTPLDPYIAYLGRLGAGVECPNGFLPLKIASPATEGRIVYFTQLGTPFLSGLLLAAPLIGDETEIVVEGAFPSGQPVGATIDAMKEFGIAFVAQEPDFIAISGGQDYAPSEGFEVPGSAALSSYPLLASAMCGKAAVQGMPPYPRLESLFKSFGADASSGEGGFTASAGALQGAEIEASGLGALALHAAVLGAVAHGETRITNLPALGARNNSRLRLLIRVLSRMGAIMNESEHTLIINGTRLQGAELEPEGDAHVAMAASAAALAADGPSSMRGAECVLEHYPSFFSDLAALGAIAREVQQLR